MITAVPDWKRVAIELYRLGYNYSEIARSVRKARSTVQGALPVTLTMDDHETHKLAAIARISEMPRATRAITH